MKVIYTSILVVLVLSSCHRPEKSAVSSSFIDSLLSNYSNSILAKTIDSNLQFWEKRMDTQPENFVNGPEYASALSSRFRLYGNILDLVKADSLFHCANRSNQEKEPGIIRTLASLAMMQHQFSQADSFLQKAIRIEGYSLPNAFLNFDVLFELGQYKKAKTLLQSLDKGNAYGYLFRRSKMEHFDGSLDSSIACMEAAVEKAGNNNFLRQVAISNTGDLYIHKGNLTKAAECYTESIKIDAADFHSIMGLGWIALVHDKNDSLAKRIFEFVSKHNQAPDALLKMEQLAEEKKDTVLQIKYATEFEARAINAVYGKMYSKYLVDLYTGILQQPEKAVSLAESEINNRPTPQIFAWYAWSLFCNKETEKAYTIYKSYVSGKPLEGPELYYMGRLMKGLDKGYNAQQFYKAAYKNRYDLSPAKASFLKASLE